jgi:hypothetical protein
MFWMHADPLGQSGSVAADLDPVASAVGAVQGAVFSVPTLAASMDTTRNVHMP